VTRNKAMQPQILTTDDAPNRDTWLPIKMFNIVASPGEEFEKIALAPPRLMNWLVPTLLVSLVAMAVAHPQSLAASADPVSGRRELAAMLDVGLSVFVGTFWSAFVLWLMGRFCLMARFSFLKGLEIVGLAGTILLLGAVVTGLLVAITRDEFARPALSLLIGESNAHPTLQAMLEVLNVFHLWTAGVLSVGLSKLSGVSFKECAFWVFGFWIVGRLALIVMA
jgi:hypothetical protein